MTEEIPSRERKSVYRILLITLVITLSNLANCIHISSRVYLFQQSLCLNYYRAKDATKVDDQSTVEEALCKIKDVQSPLSMIEGVDAFLTLLPALVMLAAYQKLVPVVGLRRLLLLNIGLAASGVFFSTLFYSFHQPWTVYGILLTFLFDLIGGGDMVQTILGLSCVALISPPDQLTKSYNHISCLWFVGVLGGSSIGSFLLSHHVYLLNTCSVICYGLTAGIAMLIPSELGREEKKIFSLEDSASNLLSDAELDQDLGSTLSKPILEPETTIARVILYSWHSSYHSILHLFSAPQPTFTVLLVFLANGLATRVNVLLPQYISLTQHWSLATVDSVLAIKAMVSAILFFLLPTFRQKLLEPRMSALQVDFSIIQAFLLIQVIGMFGLGFSLPAPLFISSLCIYTIGVAYIDSLMTYGKLTLPPGQTADDYFVRMGLIQTISGIVGSPIWAAFFSLILKHQFLTMGLPFWVSAGLYGVGFVAVRHLKRWAVFSPSPQV